MEWNINYYFAFSTTLGCNNYYFHAGTYVKVSSAELYSISTFTPSITHINNIVINGSMFMDTQ